MSDETEIVKSKYLGDLSVSDPDTVEDMVLDVRKFNKEIDQTNEQLENLDRELDLTLIKKDRYKDRVKSVKKKMSRLQEEL